MITEGELGAILSARSCDEVGSRNRAALLLMANMGLRCCEVVALTLDDVDFRNGTLTVAATKCQDARKLPLEAWRARRLRATSPTIAPRARAAPCSYATGRWKGYNIRDSQMRE